MLRVIIINGPNLNLLGRREPEIYGEDSFEDFMIYLKGKFVDSDVELTYFQSNHEGELHVPYTHLRPHETPEHLACR